MRIKFQWGCLVVILLLTRTALFALEEPKLFTLETSASHDWGRLISVYDQPNYQRLTFESDRQITIVQIGLIWDNKDNVYRPSIRQIISVLKRESESASSPFN